MHYACNVVILFFLRILIVVVYIIFVILSSFPHLFSNPSDNNDTIFFNYLFDHYPYPAGYKKIICHILKQDLDSKQEFSIALTYIHSHVVWINYPL